MIALLLFWNDMLFVLSGKFAVMWFLVIFADLRQLYDFRWFYLNSVASALNSSLCENCLMSIIFERMFSL